MGELQWLVVFEEHESMCGLAVLEQVGRRHAVNAMDPMVGSIVLGVEPSICVASVSAHTNTARMTDIQ